MDANRITAAAAAAAAAARNISHDDDEQQAKQERIDAEALGSRRLRLIIKVLTGFDEFPFRTKNKTNALVENVFGNILAIPGDAHHQQQHGELELMQADDDDDVIDQRNKRRRLELISTLEQNNRRRLKLITTLEREREYSSRKRFKIEELVDPFRTLVETFLLSLTDDVHEMLCAKEYNDVDTYRGLDSTRDTEAEVEAILLLFPDVLTRRKQLGHYIYVPIQLLALNLKAVSFVPLVARLSIELGLFEEQYRGGLLIIDAERNRNDDNYNQEYHENHENQYLQVLIKLRRMDLLKKEDIQNYGLLKNLRRRPPFGKKRFRFLIEWDFYALLHPDQYGDLPLHNAVYKYSPSIQLFKFLFEAGIRYFPKKKGIQLLFRRNRLGDTPFQHACRKIGQKRVIKVIDGTLGFYAGDTPINITEALVMAAIDENIHLDCVYFLLRRKPDILQKLLLSSTAMATVVDKNNNILGDKNNDNNGNLGGQTKTNTQKKRKRN
ncbi:hypothetical protein FRACYDRAFT_233615 [Fragilariopsis cylindrus CCMP1102]|uniref:Ankyrin n=1 Tax=Fragilariopsis cylindrus CCMP1102 TaxID=635003 RepID=A0A1E7FZ79_9STRA|nr:hypothetical protein FRACYDRAFT_233615 [Fragilariopsis cylindrus CCMP1102]|eukprot:OEU23445.1 hypothetical protein FRACYDRAFT_233615 [Fragilariopsis cylindrus CCMP1102]